MKHVVKYRGELIARFLPPDRNCKRNTEENNQISTADSPHFHAPSTTDISPNSLIDFGKSTSSILLPPHTPWNSLPFATHIQTATTDCSKGREVSSSEENDCILTMDISFHDVVEQPGDINNMTSLHMTRNPNETVGDTCQRLKLSIDKKVLSKQRKKDSKQQRQRKNILPNKAPSKQQDIIFTCTTLQSNGTSTCVQILDVSQVKSIEDLFRQFAFLSQANMSASSNNISNTINNSNHDNNNNK